MACPFSSVCVYGSGAVLDAAWDFLLPECTVFEGCPRLLVLCRTGLEKVFFL